MQNITRRQFFAVATATVTLLSGCSSQSAQTQHTEEPVEKSVGDEFSVSTKKGDVNITVDGFEISQALTDEFHSYTQIDADHSCGVLMLTLENVSYEDSSIGIDGYVDLDKVMSIRDPEGVSLAPISTGDVYGDYEASAGGYIECAEGEKVRVAVCYSVDPSLESIDAVMSDDSAIVHVTVNQA